MVPPSLEGGCDFLSHHLGVEGWVLDFLNLEFGVGQFELLVESALKVVDDLPLSADDHTRSLSVDGDFCTAWCSADVKTTETGLGSVLHQELADEQSLDVAVNDGS